MKYLPQEGEIKKLGKNYLVNIVYTVVGEQFKTWARERIDERNQRVAIDKDLMIDVDPAIAQAFNVSTAVSL